MSRREVTGIRDLTVSHWHRGHWPTGPGPASTASDLDFYEWCGSCREPLLFWELAKNNGRDRIKDHAAFLSLCQRADVRGVLVFYTPGEDWWCETCSQMFPIPIEFFVRDVYPERTGERRLLPKEWANEIDTVHTRHQCEVPASR